MTVDLGAADDPSFQDLFKDVMARVCTPVSVVTTQDGNVPFGTTVSAFASLSLAPPMVLVSLDRRSSLLSAIQRTHRFGLNVLGEDQSELALAFARRGTGDRFADVGWDSMVGVPRLHSAIGFVGCDVAYLNEGGDHQVVLGQVMAAATAPGPPLTYHARTFGTHAPHRPTSPRIPRVTGGFLV